MQQQQLYQPPEKMFLFEKGWKLLFKYVTIIWNSAQNVFDWCFGLTNTIGDWAKHTFFLIALFGLAIAFLFAFFGCLLFLLLALSDLAFIIIVGSVLFVCMSGVAALIALLIGVSRLYASWFSIHYRCPNMGCYQKMEVPVYVCPRCFRRHKTLKPSFYGVFAHPCACGKRLPTFDRLGREDLVRYCASCDNQMDKEIGRGTNIDIPIIGGQSWGKTTYLTVTTALLRKQSTSGTKPYRVAFTNPNYQQRFENDLHSLQQGNKLGSTKDDSPGAYCLLLEQSLVPKILFFYDAAGEAFNYQSKIYKHKYYEYIRGMIFLIDPFAIDAFRRTHPSEIALLGTKVAPAKPDVVEIAERLIGVLEYHRKVGRSHKVPLAVVVTKVDMLHLEHEIGLTAAQNWLATSNAQGSLDDALQAMVKKFLRTNGLNHLIDKFESYFSTVGYFSCSSLGAMPGTPSYRFTPIRALEPLQWLLMKNGINKQ